MKHIFNVFRFGGPYLRRYWGRLLAGILLGILFGASNASFVLATRTVISRMNPEEVSAPQAAAGVDAPDAAAARSGIQRIQARFEEVSDKYLDPWLPRVGRPIDYRQLAGGILLLPMLVAFRGYVGFLSSYCMAWVSERVINDLRMDVFRKLTHLSLDFYDRSTMGDLMTRVNGDTASLLRCLNVGASILVKEPVTIIGIFLAMCLIDWKLTLAAMVFFPLCVVPMAVLGKKVRRASKAGLDANIIQSSQLVEMLSGIRVVKAFGLETAQVDRFRGLSDEQVRHGMKRVRAQELLNPIIETISMVGLGAVIVYIIIRGVSVEDLVGFLTGLIFFYTPVKKLAGLHVSFEQASVGVDRLVNILQEESSIREPVQPQSLGRFESAIKFEQVSFGYGQKLVLSDISMTIPRGFKLGVAGESGSGKSTLVNLLFRFYDPSAGRVTVDGHDLREVSLGDLRRCMALVSQEVVLFDQTVAENIACGRSEATREEIEAAARAAFAHEFIMQLPKGYDTRIGERGITLSGGQRQRLAIARAFVRDAPILVLDEATAALDSQSEAEVQAAIERLEQNRTVLCVAHRLSTLVNMDQIVVMSQGRIIEQGKFDELLRAGGAFSKMARKQGIHAAPP